MPKQLKRPYTVWKFILLVLKSLQCYFESIQRLKTTYKRVLPIRIRLSVVVLLSLFLAIVSLSNAQTVIVGHVTDAAEKPLSFANVALEGSVWGGYTDDNGGCVIEGVEPGNYIVVVSMVGYGTVRQSVVVRQGQALSLVFKLEALNTKLNEVAVIAASAASQIQQKGFEMASIDAKGIQSQSIELNQMLEQVSGVRVRRTGGLGSRASYSINGLGGKSVRFFMDGVPMDYFGSSFSLSTIPVSLIRRIDVYKGVVPVELANDALGGAINLVTRQDFRNMAELSYSYGSFNTHRASLFGNWRDEASGFTVKALAFYNYSDNNYKVWGDDIYVRNPETYEIERGITVERFHDAFASKAAKVEVGWTGKRWADQLFAGVLLSDMDKDIQHGATMEVPFGEASYAQKVAMPFINYQKKNMLLTGLNANVFAAYSQLERARVDTSRNIYDWFGQVVGQRSLGGEQQRTLNTLSEEALTSRININYEVHPRHKLGFNYLYNSVERTESDPLVTQKTEGYWAPQYFAKNSLALAFQSKWWQNRLNTSLFVKHFGFNADIKVVTTVAGQTSYETVSTSAWSSGYGMAASFWPFERLMLNASFEHAVRLPAAREVLGDGLNILSTTQLKAENSNNANLGFAWQLAKGDLHQLKWTANGFYRYVTDLIQQVQYDLGAFVFINFDEVSMKGLDTSWEYNFRNRLSVNQSMSYLYPIVESDTDELGNENIAHGTRLPNTPFFTAGSQVRYNLTDHLNNGAAAFVYWNLNYVAAFYRHAETIGKDNKDEIPRQLVNNIGCGYTFPNNKWSLGVDLNNLFNEQVFDNYAVQKPGRSLFAKITYRIM